MDGLFALLSPREREIVILRYREELEISQIADRLGMPDIVSIEEIEHLSILEDIARSPRLAAARYGAVLIEGIDPRGIDVGVLYNRSKLRLIEARQRQKCMVASEAGEAGLDACTLPDGTAGKQIFARPPLVVRLAVNGSDARLTVIANHFKSKGGASEAVTTATRVLQAKHVVDLLRVRVGAAVGGVPREHVAAPRRAIGMGDDKVVAVGDLAHVVRAGGLFAAPAAAVQQQHERDRVRRVVRRRDVNEGRPLAAVPLERHDDVARSAFAMCASGDAERRDDEHHRDERDGEFCEGFHAGLDERLPELVWNLAGASIGRAQSPDWLPRRAES